MAVDLHNTSYMAERIITLPHLEFWHVLDYHWLGYIKAPALKNLHLHGTGPTGTKIKTNVIISFLCKSGCKLTSLTLFYIEEMYLAEILQHAPELVHLMLEDFADNIVDFIEYLNGPELPVPQLQSLQVMVKFHHYVFTDRLVDGLSKLLQNRQAKNNGGRQLKGLDC
jgi:hypothetical protein